MPIILALGRLRQEVQKFSAILNKLGTNLGYLDLVLWNKGVVGIRWLNK